MPGLLNPPVSCPLYFFLLRLARVRAATFLALAFALGLRKVFPALEATFFDATFLCATGRT